MIAFRLTEGAVIALDEVRRSSPVVQTGSVCILEISGPPSTLGVPEQWVTLKGRFSVVIWFNNDVTVPHWAEWDKMSC